MKILGVLSFIILVLGITFYIRSPYVHIAFLEGPIAHQKHNVEKQPDPQIARQNTNQSAVINRTSQNRVEIKEPIRPIPRQSTAPPQTTDSSLDLLMVDLKNYDSDSDIDRLDVIKKNMGFLRQNLSGSELYDILALFNSDLYREDAISALQSRLRQNLSGSELYDILALFNSDLYREDAISALRSRLKSNYSAFDVDRISKLFTSPLYRTEAMTLLHRK